MSLFKKNIVLVPSDFDGYKSEKGILSLDFYPTFIKGLLKCYNLPNKKNLHMGIMVNQEIYKFDLNGQDLKSYSFDIPAKTSNLSKISCAIINLNNNVYEAILWGSTESSICWENMKNNFFEDENKQEKMAEEKAEEENLQSYIDSVVQATEPLEEKFENVHNYEQNNNSNFYDRVKKQAENLLNNNKTDELLQEIIPSSKFCKVNFDDESGYYVFGVIFDENEPKYLCYGLPSTYSDKPPKNLDGLYQWLPLNTDDYKGDGYWLMYQRATDGENIKVDVI